MLIFIIFWSTNYEFFPSSIIVVLISINSSMINWEFTIHSPLEPPFHGFQIIVPILQMTKLMLKDKGTPQWDDGYSDDGE